MEERLSQKDLDGGGKVRHIEMFQVGAGGWNIWAIFSAGTSVRFSLVRFVS